MLKENVVDYFAEILNHILSTFFACLYANPIMPRNAVQIVVDGMETALSEGIGIFVKSSAHKLLSESKMSKNVLFFL